MVHPESIACLIRRCLVTMESPPPTGWRRSPDPLPHRAFGLSGSRRRGRQVSESSEECHHANQPRLCRNVLAACLTALTLGVAPHAAAAPAGPSCTSMGAGATLCQTTGNAQISATVVAVPG